MWSGLVIAVFILVARFPISLGTKTRLVGSDTFNGRGVLRGGGETISTAQTTLPFIYCGKGLSHFLIAAQAHEPENVLTSPLVEGFEVVGGVKTRAASWAAPELVALNMTPAIPYRPHKLSPKNGRHRLKLGATWMP